MEEYLKWRCRTNWHPKYYKYIEEWIKNVNKQQMEYFVKEKENLIRRGIYKPVYYGSLS